MLINTLFKSFKWFNKQNTALIIFILILANHIGLGLLGGEEQYFAFSKQFMQKDWMPHSFCLNHPAGYKIVFQYIIGFMLKFFSFEQLAFISRFINFLFLALPFALIFKKLRFTNIEIIFILQVGFFMHQSIWAGEWIFKNFEQKSLAYIFVLYALYNLLIERTYRSLVHASIATYFHFLVGGWFALFIVVYSFFQRRSTIDLLKHGALYLLFTLPFVVFLANLYVFSKEPDVINGININWIYSIYRLKHHVGMFSDLKYFMDHHFGGVLLSLGLFLLCVFYFRRFNDKDIKRLNTLNIIIFVQQFVFIGIALLDTNGVLLKTYPFRTSTLSALLIILEGSVVAKRYWIKSLINKRVGAKGNLTFFQYRYKLAVLLQMLLFFAFMPRFIIELNDTIRNFHVGEDNLDPYMVELINYAKTETHPESVFLFLDKDRPYSFIRRSERERFVIRKFTPTNNQIIYEWYHRQQFKLQLSKNINTLDSLLKDYKVDFIVTEKLLEHKKLYFLNNFGTYNIYSIE